MRHPWFKFYGKDWRTDAALQTCSRAAKGLWIDMLTLMHDAEPRGVLILSGRAMNTAELAALTGGNLKEVGKLLGELEAAGVFSRAEDGAIFSRRMMRDTEQAARDKANGRGGGNPRLKGGVNPPDNGADKAKSQRSEAESEKGFSQEGADLSEVGEGGKPALRVIR